MEGQVIRLLMAFQIYFLQDVKEPLGFDHRLYCKVATEVEEEKQRNFTELARSESLVEKLCQGLLDDWVEDSGGAGEGANGNQADQEEEEEEEEEEASGDESEYEYETEEESEHETEVVEERVDKDADKKSHPDDILSDLTPCDVRVLVHSEEELSQCETFERIFPTTETGHYLQYMETNYYDLLLLAWERRHDKNRQRGREMLAAFTSKVAKNRFRQNFDLNSFPSTRVCTLRFPLVRSARRVRLPKIP